MNKKIIIFTYFILLLSNLLFFIIIKLVRPEITVKISINNSACNFSEIYYKSANISATDSDNPIVFPVESDGVNTYEAVLPYPVKFFRFDPCDFKKNTIIKEITVAYQNKKIIIPLKNVEKWECNNCKTEYKSDNLIIKPFNPDPILTTDKFDEEIRKFDISSFDYIPIEKNLTYLLFFLFMSPFVYILFTLKNKQFYIGMVMIFFIFYSFSFPFQRRFLTKYFTYPAIEKNKIIGQIQFFGYPKYLDVFFINAIILSPLIFVIVNLLFNKLFKFFKNVKKK